MKHTIVVNSLLFIMTCGMLYGQAVPGTQATPPAIPTGAIAMTPSQPVKSSRPDAATDFLPAEAKARYLTVKAYMGFGSPLQRGDYTLAAMGDEAAFYIYTYIVTGPPLSVVETLTALDIIHKAFAYPAAVRNEGDLNPRKSLKVFKMIRDTAVDQSVKDRIVLETNFLATIPKTIVRPPLVLTVPPAPGIGPNNADFDK